MIHFLQLEPGYIMDTQESYLDLLLSLFVMPYAMEYGMDIPKGNLILTGSLKF